ncbi:MAG: acyltransferase domain-containing protein [Pirellulales bacterium]
MPTTIAKPATAARPDAAGSPDAAWPTELLLLRGADRGDLARRAASLADFCRQHPETRLADLAYSLHRADDAGAERLAIVAASTEELAVRLTRATQRLNDHACQQIQDGVGIYYAASPLAVGGRVAWLFPGEGAQYPNMLGDLANCFPHVRDCANTIGQFDRGSDGTLTVSDLLVLPADASPEMRAAAEQQLRGIDDGICAVLAADWAIASLLQEFGLTPDVLGGHSAGELAALSTAGCFDTAENQHLGSILKEFGSQSEAADGADAALLAIGTSKEKLAGIIQSLDAQSGRATLDRELFIGMDNCPHQVVLVGTSESIARVEPELARLKLMHERLPFNRPYHTELFRPYLGPLKRMFDAIDFHPPRTTVYSCSTGRPFPTDPAELRELALNHWAMPVEFPKMIRAMHDDGVRLFVEAGPRGNLTAFVHDILRDRPFLAMPASVARRHGLTQLQHLLGQLAAQHVPLGLDPLFAERNLKTVDWKLPPAAPTVSATPAANNVDRGPAVVRSISDRIPTPPAAAPIPAPRPNPGPSPAPQAPSIAASVQLPPTGSPRPTIADGRSAVVARHWELMERWLDDQQQVVNQFLAKTRPGAATAAPAAYPSPAPAIRVAGVAPTPPGAAAPRQPAPSHPAPQPVSETLKFALLGKIVEQLPGQSLVARRRLDLAEDHYADEHTVGGRDVSKVDPQQRGLPVVPMTFILEMMAETATQLFPGKIARAITDIMLMRWLAIEEVPGTVEMRAKVLPPPTLPGAVRAADEIHIRVEVRDLGTDSAPRNEPQQLAAVGTVVLADSYLPAPQAREVVSPATVRPCKITVDDTYKSLFHGPLFQGVRSLDAIDDQGIEGTIEVQPRRGLFTSDPNPNFLLDPVTIDIGMHPAAGWHLEQPDQTGRVLLPCALNRIELYGPRPPEGAVMRATGWVLSATQRQFLQSGELSTADGRVWCRIHELKCWRFYMPFGEVNFNGPKDQYFISKPWRPWGAAIAVKGPATTNGHGGAAAGKTVFDRQDEGEAADRQLVRVVPTPDMHQPGLQGAAARVTLSPPELRAFNQVPAGDERGEWFLGRVTAKEAVRILWRRMHGERLYTADVEVTHDDQGRICCQPRAADRPADFPSVALASAAGEYAALATSTGVAGIGLVRVDKRGALPKSAAGATPALSAAETTIARQAAKQYQLEAAAARLVAARQAVESALGPRAVGTAQLEIRSIDGDGTVLVTASNVASETVKPGQLLKVATARDGHLVVATWCGETQA